MRTTTTLRASWGAGLLASPQHTLGPISGGLDERASLVARVLGARHLLQALVLAHAGRRGLQVGIATDVLHATSMVALAALDPSHRRACLTDAGLAAAWALSGRRDLAAVAA